MKRKKRMVFITGATVIVLLGGYLIFSGEKKPGVYYFTVSEVLAKNTYGEGLRLSGRVVPGSIHWDAAKGQLSFQLSDSEKVIDVVHKGVAPDNFKPGQVAVVEGMWTPEGVFRAGNLMAKCPSKYEAE